MIPFRKTALYLAASVGALVTRLGRLASTGMAKSAADDGCANRGGRWDGSCGTHFCLSEILGQPVIVENVGNGVAATSRVAKAAPDGYHMSLSGVGQMAFHPTVYKTPVYKTPVYNVRTDFAPIALLAERPFFLVPTGIRHASRWSKQKRVSQRSKVKGQIES